MRIGISCHPSAGGSGILGTELGLAMAERGHEVHFVTFETPFRLPRFHKNVLNHSVAAVTYPLFHHHPCSLALATKIADVADEYHVDVWHAHYAIPHAASAILARDMLPADKRFKLVTTLHGTDITLVGIDPSFFRITKFSIESSDAVTAVSNWLAEETRRDFQLRCPVRTIYNFVDAQRFKPALSPRSKLAEGDEKVIMHISNFRPVKRVTDVVRVFKKVTEHVNVKLVMVGDGPERSSAVGVAKQLGVDDRIIYPGVQQDIEALLPAADLVFQPSEHESFGLVPLEAMACEVPVLGTASGGICEVVEHGVTGFLCEVGDIDAMTECALCLLTDAERAREMGRRGRERAIAMFSEDEIVGQYEAFYRQLLGRTCSEDPS